MEEMSDPIVGRFVAQIQAEAQKVSACFSP